MIFSRITRGPSLSLSRIAVREVIDSQRGVLQAKRGDLKHRLRVIRAAGLPAPLKRMGADGSVPRLGRRKTVVSMFNLSRDSKCVDRIAEEQGCFRPQDVSSSLRA